MTHSSNIEIKHPDNPAPADSPTWTTDQLRDEFEVVGFCAPFVEVKRKSDGATGLLEFNGSPRLYHSPRF